MRHAPTGACRHQPGDDRAMLFAARDRALRALHGLRCRAVWNTAPVPAGAAGAGLVLVSQVARRDLQMYLVAVKSALAALGPAQVVQLDDGSMGERDRALLAFHLPGSLCLPISAVDTGACPRGGTWERLCHILDRASDSYVVQLDADTLTCGDMDEVRACIAANRSFALGTRLGRAAVPACEAALAAAQGGTHVQFACERALASLPGAAALSYIRGSSGFAGFARGGFARARLEDFSRRMEAMLGERWREWGTEQVASNFAIANSPGAVVLPWPEHACFGPGIDASRARFLHFVGTHRFEGGVYGARSRDVLRALGAQPALRG